MLGLGIGLTIKSKKGGGGIPIIASFDVPSADYCGFYQEGTGDLTFNSYLGIGDQGGDGRYFFVSFSNITIPQGSIISAAYITFVAYLSYSTANCKGIIYLNDADTSIPPTTTAEYIALDLTDAFVEWPLPDTIDGNSYDTPEIKAVLQEVIDRVGWASGNTMTVLLKNNNSDTDARRNFTGYAVSPAVLHVEYT